MTAAMENGSVGGGCTKHKRNCAKIVVTKEQDTHAHSPTHLHTHTHIHRLAANRNNCRIS